MTFADDIRSSEIGIVRRMKASLEQARVQFHKNREISRTYAELSKLSDRELDDLGITRANIREVAHTAAYDR